MGRKIVAHNKRAGFDIEIEQRFEAGVVLTGDEIKSIREGRAQLVGGYIRLQKSKNDESEPVLIGLHLSKAAHPERTRKLLLHRREIRELERLLDTKGKTAVGLTLYLERGWAKITIGVGTGRKTYDKRRVLRQRDLDREQRATLKSIKRT